MISVSKIKQEPQAPFSSLFVRLAALKMLLAGIIATLAMAAGFLRLMSDAQSAVPAFHIFVLYVVNFTRKAIFIC